MHMLDSLPHQFRQQNHLFAPLQNPERPRKGKMNSPCKKKDLKKKLFNKIQ